MGIFLGVTVAFLIAMALSYVALLWVVFMFGVFAVTIGYFCRKDIGLGVENFFKSKWFIGGLIFVFCSGLLCALTDVTQGSEYKGFFFFISKILLIAAVYLCGLLTYFIFRNDE